MYIQTCFLNPFLARPPPQKKKSNILVQLCRVFFPFILFVHFVGVFFIGCTNIHRIVLSDTLATLATCCAAHPVQGRTWWKTVSHTPKKNPEGMSPEHQGR